MKRTRRILSLLLALVMLLPMIAVAVMAEETGVLWEGENFDAGSWSNLNSWPKSAQIVSKSALNPADKVMKIDIKGVGADSHTAPYYAWKSHSEILAITDSSYDAASNTVTGTVTVGETAYTISGTLDTGVKATCDAGTYYVYTPDMVDARTGGTNVATALTVKNPKLDSTASSTVVFQYKVWFENGTKGILASRIFTSGGKYVEFFGIKGTGGSTVTLQQHENATIVAGSAVSVTTEEWHTVSVAVDPTDKWRSVYLDGVYAFSSVNTGGTAFDLPATFDFGASKWNIIQVNRNNTSAAALAGSVMVDDIRILDASALDGFTAAPAASKTDSFESYTAGEKLSSSLSSLVYNKVLSETLGGETNKFLRVPLLYDDADGAYTPKTAPSTNWDKSIQLSSGVVTKANGKYAVLDVDYRYNKEANCTNGTVEVQFAEYKFDLETSKGATDGGTAVTTSVYGKKGAYMSLFTINLYDGTLADANGAMTKTGAVNLIENDWNHVQYVINLEDTSWQLFLNGILYGYGASRNGMYSSGGWKTCTNISNLVIPANKLIFAKVNKKDASFHKIGEADATYSNVNYVDVDNVTLSSTNVPPTVVLPPVKAFEGFESGTVGGALSSSYSSTNTAYNKVLSETVEGNTNKFLRVPLLYDGTGSNTISTNGYTNYDKTVTMKHATISTDTGKYAVFTVDYRPHAEANASSGTIEIQIHNYKFDALVGDGSQKSTEPQKYTFSELAADEKGVTGIYLKLFDINLATGELTGNTSDSLKKTGAKGLNLDEWNTIQFVMNLEDSSSSLFVNGSLYGVSEKMQATSGSWYYYTSPSNIVFTNNCLFAAKVNKKDAAFNKLEEADATYSDVNYIDIDNISLESATEKDITVLDSVNADGDVLMYVEIKGQKVANENLYLTEDIEYEVSYFDPDELKYDGIISTVSKSSIRLKGQAGLRFATEIADMEKFDALFALEGEDFKDVAFGTLIVPTDYVSDIAFTVEALEEAGRNYLAVEANYGHYYAFDSDDSTTHFVGSIVSLNSGNIDRPFNAIGYIKITLWGGQEFYFYSDATHTANVKAIAQRALDDTTVTWGAFEKSILNTYAAGNTMDGTIANDMNGLNVLAFGDSLFGGTVGYDQATQWVNKLGVDNEWNLTNLGIGSMTVSLTERNNVGAYGNKNSMYDWMFNNKNDFRWNSTATPSGTNPFFKTGVCTDNKDDVELIILEGGCNDYGTAISAPLGTVDSKDPGTFLGAWNCITERLLEEYSNATIVFLTTWRLNPQTRTDDTLTSIEFSESVITLYNEKYASNSRIALIDAGDPAVSGVDMLDTEWRTEYSTDSYHLKDTGMAVMADHMLPLLWEIVMKARDRKN